MNIKSIVGVTDFSTAGNAALERAAQLAVRHRAALELMSMPAAGDQKKASAALCLADAARQLAQRYGLNIRPTAKVASSLEHLAGEAGNANLLVLAQRRQRTVSAIVLGSPAERLLRLCHCPVLVVKSAPRKRYGRILVAVDFTPESRALAELASGIDSEAELALFHALGIQNETTLRASNVSAEIVASYRNHRTREARGRMIRFTDSLGVRSNRVSHAIGRGDPGRQAALQQRNDGADLVVVGRRRRSTLSDVLLGSVAHDVLRRTTSDVLVAPHDFRSPERAVSSRSAAAGCGDLSTQMAIGGNS